jgi:hypothetical protein
VTEPMAEPPAAERAGPARPRRTRVKKASTDKPVEVPESAAKPEEGTPSHAA